MLSTGRFRFSTGQWVGLVALALSPFAGTDRALAAEKVFRAGAFAIDVTPQFPISVNGNMTDHRATHAHDRLHARCLVLDDGTTKLGLAVVDSCMIPRPIHEAAKQRTQAVTGIPAAHLLISATHTHEAPTLAGVFQSEPDPTYVEFLPQRIAEGFQRAAANLAPARIGWAMGRDPTQVFNRRWRMKPGTVNDDPFGHLTDQVRTNPGYNNPSLLEPAGPTDPQIGLLAVQSRGGQPIALLANYSLHYVGDVPGDAVSADYFGAFAERMEELLNARNQQPPFVGIMSNGTSGNINNVNFRKPWPRRPTFGQTRFVADSVAQAAYTAVQTIHYHDWVPLAVKQRELQLGVRRPSAGELEHAKQILAQAKKPVLTGLREVYAREAVKLADYPATVPVLLQAMRIGDLGIAAAPCEVFVEIGLAIKEQSPLQPTFTISLANGYNGYLPTPEQHRLGGYETWRARSSYLEINAATKIQSTLLELLRELAP